jgi:hypothetical protein
VLHTSVVFMAAETESPGLMQDEQVIEDSHWRMDELGNLQLVTAAEQRKKYMQLALKAGCSANVELSSNEMLWASRRISLFECTMAGCHARQPRGTQTYHQREIDGPKHVPMRYARLHTAAGRAPAPSSRHAEWCDWDLMSRGQQKDDQIIRDFQRSNQGAFEGAAGL